MIRDQMKKQQAKILAQRLGESEALENVAQIVATLERRQLEQVAALEDELGIDHITSLPNVDDRREQLQTLIQTTMSGEFDEYWLKHVGAAFLEDVDDAEQYLGVGLGSAEWDDAVARWADLYREQLDDVDGATDRELADRHVRAKWGVDLETFEDRIVDFDEGQAARQLFAANFETVERGIELAREEIGDDVDDEPDGG